VVSLRVGARPMGGIMQTIELFDEISGKLAQVGAILDLVISDGGGGGESTIYNAAWGARDISNQAKRIVEELSCLLNPSSCADFRSLTENLDGQSASTTD